MKWNKNAASQKGRVFRSGLLSTAMLAAVLVLAVYLPLHLLSFPCSFAPSLESYALPCAFGDGTPISVYIIGHLPWIVNNLSANLLMKWANPIGNAQFVTDCLTFCLFFSRNRRLHGT